MLTQKMIRVITLLKQIDGFPQVLCAEDAVLLDDFCRAGLVHRMGDNESTSCRYALIKPLRQESLRREQPWSCCVNNRNKEREKQIIP